MIGQPSKDADFVFLADGRRLEGKDWKFQNSVVCLVKEDVQF